MRMIRPKLQLPQATVAEEQEEFATVTAALYPDPRYGSMHESGYNTLIVCYELNGPERDRILRGEPIYLHLLTFGGKMQPHWLSVGTEETAEMLGVKVEEGT